MEIIKNNVDDLMKKTKYTYQKKYSDTKIDDLYNYWMFFEEKEVQILDVVSVSLGDILYSKYYWCVKFVKKFCDLYPRDVGLEQQQYKIFEEIEQKLGYVDWELIELLEDV